ncbi:MAG: thiazole synthase [Deltaproteobacteria bacterium]|nr:MAG: thiazole synthase [Deltaproteobacteria bacterium]
MRDEPLVLGELELTSRLIVGTGRYPDFPTMRAAIAESGAELVTVALRRLDLEADPEDDPLKWLPEGVRLLPNTAGCYTAEEAVRTAHLAREAAMGSLLKLEVIGDDRTLFPNGCETLKAAERLVADGFTVLPYCLDDPILCKELEAVGCAAVMPLAAPIGSGLGIRNPTNLRIILEQVRVPVIVDAGVGTASDAAVAMELGCAGILMNTAIAGARDPVRMARAMRLAVQAGRHAFLAGRIEKRLYATASSPLDGRLQ